MAHFIVKRIQERKFQKRFHPTMSIEKKVVTESFENKEENDINMMDTKEKIKLAAEILDNQPKIKRVKKEKGLIEKVEKTKTILTEDNKELLMD